MNWLWGGQNKPTEVVNEEVDEGKPKVKGFTLFTDEDFDKFIEMCDSTDGWVECHKSDKLVVHKKQDPQKKAPIDIIRIRAKLDVPVETVLKVLQNPKYRKAWDERLLKNGLVESLDENNDIKFAPPISLFFFLHFLILKFFFLFLSFKKKAIMLPLLHLPLQLLVLFLISIKKRV